MTFQKSHFPFLLVALSGIGSASAAALPANPVAATAKVPAALRPAYYEALAREAGPAYRIDRNGCANLPQSALKACFDAHGAHFSGNGADTLALQLESVGRGDKLNAMSPIAPRISGNGADYAHDGVTEWWRATPLGYEQGFTVTQRPSGSGELTVALASNRAGRTDGDGLAWGKLHYGGLTVVDGRGKVLPATLKNAGDRLLISTDDSGATYPLTIDPTVWLEQKVTADDGVAGDSFGTSAVIDGTTALIGAIGGADSPGAVYVFTNQDGTWTQTEKLTADDGADGDQFGYSVALKGDTAVIGSVFAAIGDNGHQGAVYVFKNDGTGTWLQSQKLVAADGAIDDQLGWSVAYDGTRIIGGAPGVTIDGNFATGTVYVFENDGTQWNQSAELNADDGTGSSDFGFSVAVAGDRLLIAAANADVDGVTAQGAAYAFTYASGAWTQAQKIVPADDGGANFGYAMAYDGVNALISSPFSTVGDNAFQGAVYAYVDDGTTFTQTQKIVTDDGQTFDVTGISVAMDGDTAVFGSPFVNASQGAGYLFQLSGDDGWVQQLKFTASDSISGDGAAFGFSAAIGGGSLLFGQALATINENASQGAAYFYVPQIPDEIFADGFDGQ